ncbi:MAG: DUF5615 family PIN-like protein [Nitrospinae bacterium]|nr:DUF5615 family PIN-like protein [Nitrospinota bacterium]
MRLFADENLPEPIIEYLRTLGHDVLSIRGEGLCGMSDDDVYLQACRENRVVVTMDKDFTRVFRFPPADCGGIIVVKIYKRTISETLAIFKRMFDFLDEQNITRNLVVISPEGVRIRRTNPRQG